jgi:phosphate starvation-inducible protein PhoH
MARTSELSAVEVTARAPVALSTVSALVATNAKSGSGTVLVTDVVRHPLVQEIIKAYDKHERKKAREEA